MDDSRELSNKESESPALNLEMRSVILPLGQISAKKQNPRDPEAQLPTLANSTSLPHRHREYAPK